MVLRVRTACRYHKLQAKPGSVVYRASPNQYKLIHAIKYSISSPGTTLWLRVGLAGSSNAACLFSVKEAASQRSSLISRSSISKGHSRARVANDAQSVTWIPVGVQLLSSPDQVIYLSQAYDIL